MASSAGRLIVEIIATTAQFQSDLGKASAAAEAHAKKIDSALAGVRASIVRNLVGAAASVGAVFTAAGFVNMIRGTIDAQDHLLQLSKSTGISVEQLGGLGFAATQTGGNLDDMASSFRRFSVNAALAAAGSEKELATFRALNITLEDLRTLKPDELFVKAADAFASFNEGPNKARIASEAFGRAYQGILPTLDQGGARLQQNIDYYRRFGGVTTEVAEQSEQFKQQLDKASLLAGALGRNITADLLPGMKVLVNNFVESKEKGDQFRESASHIADIVQNLAIFVLYGAHAFDSLGTAVGAAAARIDALAHGDFKRFQFIGEDEEKRVEEASKRFDALIAQIRNARKETEKPFVGPPEPPKKKRDAPGLPTADAAAAARKELEAALRGLDMYISQEQDLLRQRESFLTDYYQDDKIGITDYFARRAGIIDEALAKERAALDEEEALVEKHKAGAKPTERAEDEKKLADIQGKRAKIEQNAAAESIKGFILQGRALDAFRDKVEELGIAEAEARGDPAAAAARFDFEHRQIADRLALERESTNELVAMQARIGTAALEQLRARFLAQQKLNDVTQAFGNVFGVISNAQSRIDLAIETGNATEIEGLKARGELAQRYVGILQQAAAAREAFARANLTGPALDAELVAIDALKLHIEQLASESDLLAKKFRDVFETDFADALMAAETGAKSFKDIIRDLAKSIETDLLRIANKNIAESLFGKGGPLGGVGDFFAGIFGGKGALGGADTGAAALTGAGAVLETAGTALLSSAGALSAAAATMGVSGASSSIFSGLGFGPSSFAGIGFGAAKGTDFAPGGLAIVGERGPEVVNLPRGSQVIPNDALRRGGRGGIYAPININVAGNVDTRSAAQIGREVALRLHLAVNRS